MTQALAGLYCIVFNNMELLFIGFGLTKLKIKILKEQINMYKGILLILAFLCCTQGYSLLAQDFERIDAVILLYPKTVDSPEELSKFITRDFTTEEEKVRAIYSWIIENVAYDPEAYKMFNYNFKNYRERNQKEEKTRKKIIEFTLKSGLAVCEGYAMTFEKLLEIQGIPNYLVRGDTKTHFKDIGRSFDTNHMWNVALIDEQPFLFDLTWGAGKFTDKFIKEPSYFYYKTDPGLFFKTHYPDMLEDAFVGEMVSREDFAFRPILIQKELRLNQIVRPKYGMLESADFFGEIPFLLEALEVKKVSYSFGNKKKELVFLQENNQLSFSVPIELGKENLLIFFDDQPALAYRIN
jgi:hypothetical protein